MGLDNTISILPSPISIRMDFRLRDVLPLFRLHLTIDPKLLIPIAYILIEIKLPLLSVARHQLWRTQR